MTRPAETPSGIVTFVFTDIEGSTLRWDRDPVAMAAALRVHDALVRSAIEGFGGYVFKTIGDAFCAAFERPHDAIDAARAIVTRLRGEDFSSVDGLRVRVAVMTGTADERDRDYFGPVVNRVSRLLAIGHGDQILVGSDTAGLLGDRLPASYALRDLGSRRLKDLARPEHVRQLVGPDLPDAFATLRSLDLLPNNLPQQRSSFVGREADVESIRTLLANHKLVTLVGTGGIGKTRCAIHVGAQLLDGSGDGVWLVEFAPLGDPSLAARLIANALGLEGTGGSPLDTIVAYLKRKRLLLIFDNCEHVIDEVRDVTTAILRACVDVRILVTSRERLGVAGERVFRMPSLGLPPVGEGLDARAADRYGALALFFDRATASDERFRLTDENAPAITDICRRLDGIPLALELAAARVNVLPPKQLARRLDQRFAVLVGGDRTALPRQQTMRALIDWSYDLLDEQDRRAFRELAIFAGSFTFENASDVCSGDPADDFGVLERLSSLVDKSLVQADPSDDVMRYALLESTRQYAREKLVESNEYDRTTRAHAETYARLAEARDAAWEDVPDRDWAAFVEPDLDNWRAALEWSLDAGADVPLGRRLVAHLHHVMLYFGAAELERWIDAARAGIDAATPPSVAARLDALKAHRMNVVNQYAAGHEIVADALERGDVVGDETSNARLRLESAFSSIGLGRVADGESLMNDVVAIARRLGKHKLLGDALLGLAQARYFSDDIAGARACFAEALRVAETTGNPTLAAQVRGNLAEAEYRAGALDAAVRLATAALEQHRALRNLAQQANNLCNIAGYSVALDRFDDARTGAREALVLARDVRYDVVALFSMQHLAAAAALETRARSQWIAAAQVLGYVDARLAKLGSAREFTELDEYERVLRVLDEELGRTERVARATEARDWSEDVAVERAMAL